MDLPIFEGRDMHGSAVTDRTLATLAPVLVVLLRGFA